MDRFPTRELSSSEKDRVATLGLLVARVYVAADRVIHGVELDDIDQAVLSSMATHLRSEAEAVLAPGVVPGSNLPVGIVLDEFPDLDRDSDEAVAGCLTGLADQLDGFGIDPHPDTAQNISAIYEKISHYCLALGGSTGEIVHR